MYVRNHTLHMPTTCLDIDCCWKNLARRPPERQQNREQSRGGRNLGLGDVFLLTCVDVLTMIFSVRVHGVHTVRGVHVHIHTLHLHIRTVNVYAHTYVLYMCT